SDIEEVAIESELDVGPDRLVAKIDPMERPDMATTRYLRKMMRQLPARALQGWKIVVDTANGATWETTPEVLAGRGAEVVQLGGEPDGHNINAGVGSEHPEALAQRVVAEGARLGIAHDGDGDRCILCDETGAILDGDEVLTLLARHALAQGELAGGV